MFLNRYIVMDKDIVTQGSVFDFDIFEPTECKKNIKLFKDKNSSITDKDVVLLNENEVLYICKTDENLYQNHLDTILKGQRDAKINPASINIKSQKFYKNATKTIDELFKNPESIESYQSSKKVLHNLTESIADEEFTIKSLISSTAQNYSIHIHSLNVAIYSMSIGSYLKMDQKSLSELGEAAILHDIGKSKIDPEIVNKNGLLTDAEFSRMKTHTAIGYIIAMRLGITNKKILLGIKYHHENIDGSGYPDGLFGRSIPLYARIISICDKFDALTSKRPYQDALSTFDAIKFMKTQMKNELDQRLLTSMIMMFK